MGKRQLRIAPEKISDESAKILYQYIHVVMKSGRVCMGVFTNFEPTCITIKDAFNILHKLSISEISEVLYDYTADN